MICDEASPIFHLLHRVSQVADERFFKAIGRRDVTPRQLLVLAVVEKHGSPSQTDLVFSTGVDRSTMGEIVGRLGKRGLVSRQRSRLDARVKVVKITPEGRRMLNSALPILRKVEQDMLQPFQNGKQLDIVKLLGAIITNTEANK